MVSDELGWLTDALMFPTFWLSLISWLVLFCGIATDMYRYQPASDRKHWVVREDLPEPLLLVCLVYLWASLLWRPRDEIILRACRSR